ncbi:MAG: helix-turn-helix domain-containing protein [Parvibaculaceae bacterium]
MTQPKSSSEPQLVRGPEGDPLYALVPVQEYERLKRAADDIADIKASHEAVLGDRAVFIPAEVVHRIADGENPVRVWREHRGLKGVELARAAGISPAYLSEIETGKKDGTFRTMTAIGTCLGVPLDDLAPVVDEDDRAMREQAAKVNDIRAQIRHIEDLIVGPGDFNTAQVRQAAATLAADAQDIMANADEADDWLKQVLSGVEEILDLIDRAEGDIIETARSTRADLERVVSLSTFRAPVPGRVAS